MTPNEKRSATIKRLHAEGKYNYDHFKGNKFKAGKEPWNKGVPMLPHVKEALVESHKGKPSWNKGKFGLPSGKKGKIYPHLRGENHWNWQGGKTEEIRKLRNSTEYKVWRTAVFERDNYTCVLCGDSNCYLEADHIKQFALFPDLRFNLSNGRTLCVDCHRDQPVYSYNGKRNVTRIK